MANGPTVPAVFQPAFVAAASVTGTNAGTANTALTLTRYAKEIFVKNDTDVSLGVTVGGVTVWYLSVGASIVIDAAKSGISLSGGTVIGVHRDGSAATTGRVQVLAI